MLKGKKLTSASTIGIIAPASPENKDKIDKKLWISFEKIFIYSYIDFFPVFQWVVNK